MADVVDVMDAAKPLSLNIHVKLSSIDAKEFAMLALLAVPHVQLVGHA